MTNPGRQITFTVEIDAQGKAIIRLPEGKTQQADANKLADLTLKLAESLGPIEERHVGDHEHHHHDHHHGTDESHQTA